MSKRARGVLEKFFQQLGEILQAEEGGGLSEGNEVEGDRGEECTAD